MEYLIIVKIVAVPLLLWLVSIIVRRWGEFVGALVSGLPLVSGPVSLIITLEQGVEFASGMAYNALPGICACIFFGVVYSWLATRLRWQATLAVTLLLYFSFAALLCMMPRSLPLFSVLALGAPLLGLRLLPRPAPHHTKGWKAPTAHKGPPWMQMGVGMTAMIGETEGAAWLGPQWSGILIFFPVISGVVGLFAHIENGSEAVIRVFRGTFTGFTGATTFALTVAWLVTSLPVWLTYSLAAVAAMGSSALVAHFVKK